MILLELFNNISEYTGKPINFSEYQVDSLFYLEFEDSGLELKNIIETVYTDGIDGFEDVENDGTKITGIFIDRVSSGLTKRFRFTVTEDNISYKLLNPEDLDNLDDADFAELDFATTPTGKKKKCVKGQSCGNTCITKNAECNAKPPREVKNSVKNILAKAAKPPKVAKGSVKQVQEKAARPPKVAKGSVKQVQEKAAKPPKEPKTTKAKKETEKEAEATKTKQSNLDRIEQIKKTAQAIKESQEKEVAKKTTTKQETPKTQAKVEETKTQAKKYPLDDEKDFEDAILNKFAELSNKYNGLVPIYQLRRELGETVPRDKFNNYMLNMQGNDLLQFKGGSVEDSARDKIADSLHTELDGIRAYAALGDGLTKESLNKRVSDTKDKVNTALKDKKPLSELGSAAALANAPKIKNQREFDDAIEEASNRLNNEFIMGGIVPIEKLRKSLGDRVSKEDFDNMMLEYIDRKDLNLGSNQRATESEIKNGIKDTFSGEVKDYLRIGSENKSKELVESKYPKSPEERFGSVEPQKKSEPESKKEAKTEPKKETKPEPKKELSNDVNEDTFSQLGHTGLEKEISYGIYKKATEGKYGEYSDLLKEASLQRSDSRDYARGWMDRAPEIVRIANKEKIGSEDATELMDYADEQGMFRTGTPAGKVAAYAMLNSYAKADESGKKVIRERLQKMSDLKLVPDNQIGEIDPEHNDLIDELRRIQQDKKAEPQKEAKKESITSSGEVEKAKQTKTKVSNDTFSKTSQEIEEVIELAKEEAKNSRGTVDKDFWEFTLKDHQEKQRDIERLKNYDHSGHNLPKNYSNFTANASEKSAYMGRLALANEESQISEAALAAKRMKAAGKDQGLDVAELAAINNYTRDAYSYTNKYLRSEGDVGSILNHQEQDKGTKHKRDANHLEEDTISDVRMVTSALNNLPNFEGTVYRGSKIPSSLSTSDFESLYKEGAIISEAGLTSTSNNKDTKFAGEVQYEIVSKTGKGIKDISAHPEENEVLFLPNTKFKVSKFEKTDKGYLIKMEEV